MLDLSRGEQHAEVQFQVRSPCPLLTGESITRVLGQSSSKIFHNVDDPDYKGEDTNIDDQYFDGEEF